MTALSADRKTPSRDGKSYSYPMAASKEIFAGSIVFLDTSGNAEPAAEATGKICAGVAQEYKNNTGAAAAKSIVVASGVFRFVNGEAITKAHIGDLCYANDDQTVYRTSTGRSAVGAIVDVDAGGVWVSIQAPLAASTAGLLAANNLSDLGTVATAIANLGLQDGSHSIQVDDATVDGAATIAETLDVAGAATGLQKFHVVAAGAYTVDPADGDIVIHAAADNDVVTLPDAAAGNKGLRVTVQNAGADGACLISVSPHASDGIRGGVHGAAGGDLVSFAGTHDKDAQNTKATAKEGDYLVLVSDGVDDWWVVGGKGVWATQA